MYNIAGQLSTVLGATSVLSESESLAHALVSDTLSVTVLPSPCTEVEGAVSKAFDKVDVGSYIARTEVSLCFG